MRYCVIADIHGNIEAFRAVLDDAGKAGVDGYLCAGDVVGYGADPRECIALVRSLKPKALVSGNHEWGVLGFLDLEYFNEYAGAAITWTRAALGKEDLDYLNSFQLTYEENSFTVVHGTLDDPGKFCYIFDKDDVYPTMEHMKTPACFVGHSHAAGIFYSDKDGVRCASEAKINIAQGRKYVINVGSVGQPRDGDPRSSYAIYDEGGRTVEIRRVGYDIEAARKKIMAAGLPVVLAARLSEGK